MVFRQSMLKVRGYDPSGWAESGRAPAASDSAAAKAKTICIGRLRIPERREAVESGFTCDFLSRNRECQRPAQMEAASMPPNGTLGSTRSVFGTGSSEWNRWILRPEMSGQFTQRTPAL